MKEKLNLNPQNKKGKSRRDGRMHFFQLFRIEENQETLVVDLN
jgi:hypothetical protein